MEGVREAARFEAERCIRIWGSGGCAAEVMMQCHTWVPAASGSGNDSAEAGAGVACHDEKNTKVVFGRSRP